MWCFNQHKGNIAIGKFLQADRCFHELQAHAKQTDRQNVQYVTVRRVVSLLDSGAEGPGFKSQSRRCWVTVLGKLFTSIVPLFTKQQNWQQPS